MAGFLTAAGNLLGSYLDFRSNERNNMNNWNMQHETNMMNAQLNQQNIEFQKAENEIARQREDNAVQRRAADLMGAGLSKTLAAGSPASANAMQAPANTFAMNAPKFQAYKGFETAATHMKEAMVAEKQLDVDYQRLENEEFKAQETARHNKVSEEHEQAVVDENKRFHDIENDWKRAELEQNAKFHDDSMELSWAKQTLDERLGLSEIENKEHQNVWYDTQSKLARNEDRRAFMKLTADLAESDARVGLYLSDKQLNRVQIEYLKRETSYIGAMAAEKVATIKHLSAETKDTLANAFTKLYNLWLAKKEGTTTTGHIVSSSEATENKRGRHTELAGRVIGIAGTIGVVGVGAFIKTGGASRVWNKMFGEDAQLARAAKYWGL